MTASRQHLVSQVLLRRFAPFGALMAANLERGTEKQRSPAQVGYRLDFVRHDQAALELLWKSVEDRLPAAFGAVDAGRALDDPGVVRTLKDCMALHWARSNTLLLMHELIVPAAIEKTRRKLIDDPAIDVAFASRYGGLVPAGREARSTFADDTLKRVRAPFDDGRVFAERVVAHFHSAQDLLSAANLEIGVVDGMEFLIGDTPCVSVRVGRTGVGPLGGVAWNDASTIVLPIGPRHTLGLGPEQAWISVPPEGGAKLNEAQVHGAQRQVMYSLQAGLLGFVRRVVAEQREDS